MEEHPEIFEGESLKEIEKGIDMWDHIGILSVWSFFIPLKEMMFMWHRDDAGMDYRFF